MIRTLIILCTVVASVIALPEYGDIDMVFVVDDSSRLREFKLPGGDPLLSNLMLNFAEDIWLNSRCRMGLVTYGDKPVVPRMNFRKTEHNYCSKRRLSLQPSYPKFAEEVDKIDFVTQASDYEAMTDAHAGLMEAMNPEIGWRESTNEKPVLHLIVLIAGANARLPGVGLHDNWGSHEYKPNNGGFNYDCNDMDYYSTHQVLTTMQKMNVLPYVFTWYGFFDHYKKMIDVLNRGKIETFRANVWEVLRAFYFEEPPRRLTATTNDDEGNE